MVNNMKLEFINEVERKTWTKRPKLTSGVGILPI